MRKRHLEVSGGDREGERERTAGDASKHAPPYRDLRKLSVPRPDGTQAVFNDVLQHLAVPSYADDGILFGPYYEGNEGTAIYNSKFRPFQSPVPFLFVRNGVISDWKFFLDNDEWLEIWARRYGQSAVQALAAELRRTNWRQLG